MAPTEKTFRQVVEEFAPELANTMNGGPDGEEAGTMPHEYIRGAQAGAMAVLGAMARELYKAGHYDDFATALKTFGLSARDIKIHLATHAEVEEMFGDDDDASN